MGAGGGRKEGGKSRIKSVHSLRGENGGGVLGIEGLCEGEDVGEFFVLGFGCGIIYNKSKKFKKTERKRKPREKKEKKKKKY